MDAGVQSIHADTPEPEAVTEHIFSIHVSAVL